MYVSNNVNEWHHLGEMTNLTFWSIVVLTKTFVGVGHRFARNCHLASKRADIIWLLTCYIRK